jgi:hypothetical protein
MAKKEQEKEKDIKAKEAAARKLQKQQEKAVQLL